MNALLLHTLTMSSREIAELTGKRHDNVMRDTRKLLVELHGEGGILKFEETYTDPQNGNQYPVYQLPKRETLVLISGYSITTRAKIIDRWLELEAQDSLANQEPHPNQPLAKGAKKNALHYLPEGEFIPGQDAKQYLPVLYADFEEYVGKFPFKHTTKQMPVQTVSAKARMAQRIGEWLADKPHGASVMEIVAEFFSPADSQPLIMEIISRVSDSYEYWMELCVAPRNKRLYEAKRPLPQIGRPDVGLDHMHDDEIALKRIMAGKRLIVHFEADGRYSVDGLHDDERVMTLDAFKQELAQGGNVVLDKAKADALRVLAGLNNSSQQLQAGGAHG